MIESESAIMNTSEKLLLCQGIVLILWIIASFFHPPLIVRRKLLERLQRDGKKRVYLVWSRINMTLLGAVLIASAFLEVSCRKPAAMILEGLICVSVIACNLYCFGTLTGFGALRR